MSTVDRLDSSGTTETILMDDNVKPFLVPQTFTIRKAMEQLE